MTGPIDYQQTLDLAIEATRAGRPDEADALLRQASRMDASAAIPYFLLGANAAEAGNNDAAESAFIACLSRAPNLAIARFQLGLLQMTNGRPAVAAATWEPLFLLDDRQPLRHFAAGLLAITHGDAAAARHSIEQGIALNVDNVALNDDMRGVLSRLAALQPGDVAPTTSSDASAEAEVSTEHVLLSAYRQP